MKTKDKERGQNRTSKSIGFMYKSDGDKIDHFSLVFNFRSRASIGMYEYVCVCVCVCLLVLNTKDIP